MVVCTGSWSVNVRSHVASSDKNYNLKETVRNELRNLRLKIRAFYFEKVKTEYFLTKIDSQLNWCECVNRFELNDKELTEIVSDFCMLIAF